MNVWVTGYKGMLGTAICKLLTSQKIPFIGTDHTVDISCDNTLNTFIEAHSEITHIINCAAYTQVDKAEQETDLAYNANTLGPKNLGKIAQKHKLPITHFSTDYVFDGAASTPYKETALCNPIGVYAKTKWEGEIEILKECPFACIIRTSWLFGLYGKNFVATMLNLMQQRDSLNVVSDQMGRPTFCDDLAEATLQLLGQKGIFHFANKGMTSWYAFAQQIAQEGKHLGYPLKIEVINPINTAQYPTPAKRPAFSTFCTQKIENTLNYVPRSWQEALSDYLIQSYPKL